MGELLSATGKISITGDKNVEEKTDRVVFRAHKSMLLKTLLHTFIFARVCTLKVEERPGFREKAQSNVHHLSTIIAW